jgi:hypothetical protein
MFDLDVFRYRFTDIMFGLETQMMASISHTALSVCRSLLLLHAIAFES